MEKRTRAAIKGVLPCDVTQDNPVAPLNLKFLDCITSSLCLEVASKDETNYRQVMKNITSLIKPGGHLVLFGIINEKCYPVGEETFFSLPVDEELLTTAVTGANCNILSLDIKGNAPDSGSHTDGCYFLVAKKLSD